MNERTFRRKYCFHTVTSSAYADRLQTVLAFTKHRSSVYNFCSIWHFFYRSISFFRLEEDAKVKGQPREGIEYVWSVYFCAGNLYLSSRTETDREMTFLRGGERGLTVSFRHFDVTYLPMPETIDCPSYATFLQLWTAL
jgi:hypothetical protein